MPRARRTSIENASDTEQVFPSGTTVATPTEAAEAWAAALRHLPQRYEAHVPLDRLREHPQNPRRGSMRALDESVDTLGFYGVLYVQEGTGYVLAGNHRLKKLRAAGAPWVDVIWLTVDDATALKILLADNRVGDLGTYDSQALARLLEDLSTADQGLTGTGYSATDLDLLLRELPVVDAPAQADLPPSALLSPEAKRDTYEAGLLRQIVLVMDVSQYETAVAWLAELRRQYDLETNTDVVVYLLEQAVAALNGGQGIVMEAHTVIPNG